MKALKFAAIFALFAVPAAAEDAGAVVNPGISQEIGTFSGAGQEQLRRNLLAAGFEHIDIEAIAYVVRARSGDGRQVVIRVEPEHGANALSAPEIDDLTVTGSIRAGG
jgi:hypothetical protein